ncbi:MAG: hypothetical protein MI723_15245, partial [Caulobacterales bacterium]|nr:hypothetical protein [Caulobacterales bacterium]
YHLAAAEGEAIEQTLSDAVIMVLAVYNPDGHALRAKHVEAFSGVVPVGDPANQAHRFRTARMNHYWFDLNRQWLWTSQPESKAIVDAWRRWKPYMSADFHEMGPHRTFYFHPGEPRRVNPIIPDEARELNKQVALSHVEWLDSEQRLYYSAEGYDSFYFGKGSTYPMMNGGLGILFELGSARAGYMETPGGVRTYADNVLMGFRVALTTIEGVLSNRDAIEAYQREFFRTARAEGASATTRAYVFTAAGDRARLNRFLTFLLRHDITVHRLAAPFTVGERTYDPGGAFIISTDQDQYRMIQVMFERLTEFEENIYYDVSAWNAPLAFDLDYDALSGGRGAGSFNPALLGEELTEAPQASHAPPSPDGAYGYVFQWSEYYAPRALYRLLSQGVRVRVATKPATAPTADGGVALVRGSVFVPLVRQDVEVARIEEIVAAIAEEDGVEVIAATSGYTPEEGVDLGGPSFHPLDEAPSVLLLFDDGLSHYESGEVWHLLDYRMHMPVTLRPKRDLGRLDMSRYTHLVLVGGDKPDLDEAMTEAILG